MSHNLIDNIQNGLVIFCGAGVSMVEPTCLPSWWQMNEQVVLALSSQIVPFSGEKMAADFAKQINTRRNNKRFPPEFQAEIISKHYGSSYFKVLKCLDGNEPNVVHLGIAELARSGYVRAIITSNFDRLLEIAFKNLEVPLKVHYQTQHFESLANELEKPSSKSTNCQLLKLHGSVEDHNTLVDTLAQRMRGLSPAICSCLRHLLKNHYWLFLGYSGSDLEGNPQYLCLQSEVKNAKGFSWLIRESSKDEPIEAVRKLSKLYGSCAEIIRGDLPSWLFDQLGSLLPGNFSYNNHFNKAEMESRKQDAAQAIIQHTNEWSKTLGGLQAGLIIADMLANVVGNPQEACELLTIILNKQKDNNNIVTVANSLANIYNNQGDLVNAMQMIEIAMANANSETEKIRAGLMVTLGLIKHKEGNYQQALDHFEKAYLFFSQLNDDDLMSIAMHNRAMALESLGEYDLAKECYEQELDIVRKMGDVIAQAQTLNNIGELLQEQDHYDEAIDVLNKSIELRERLGDDRGVAQCLGNIAVTYSRKGDLTKAKLTYEKVLAIFQKVEDLTGEINTWCHLGLIDRDIENFSEAEQFIHKGLMIATKYGLEHERAGALWNLASVYKETNRSTEAHRLYDEAIIIYQNYSDKKGEADVLNELGILLWQTGHFDEAILKYNQAIEIREQLNQKAALCEAIGNLAIVYMEKQDFDKAYKLLTKKLSVAEEIHSKGLIANANYNIGVLYHRKGMLEKSLNYFEIGQQLLIEMGNIYKAIDILCVMGEANGSVGKIGASLHWFDRAIKFSTQQNHHIRISKGLSNILGILVQNGYDELAQEYVNRLKSVGAEVKITLTNPE